MFYLSIFVFLLYLNQAFGHFYGPNNQALTSSTIIFRDQQDDVPYDQVPVIESLARGSHSLATNTELRIWSSNPNALRRMEPILFTELESKKSSQNQLTRSKRQMATNSIRQKFTMLPSIPFSPSVPVSTIYTPFGTMYDHSADQMERRRQKYPKNILYGPYKKYGENEDDCQYHTLVNGDSEIILRKFLPLRLVGRTILRHCIPKSNTNDPRYKVLLKGNNKSSFGSIRFQMIQ